MGDCRGLGSGVWVWEETDDPSYCAQSNGPRLVPLTPDPWPLPLLLQHPQYILHGPAVPSLEELDDIIKGGARSGPHEPAPRH